MFKRRPFGKKNEGVSREPPARQALDANAVWEQGSALVPEVPEAQNIDFETAQEGAIPAPERAKEIAVGHDASSEPADGDAAVLQVSNEIEAWQPLQDDYYCDVGVKDADDPAVAMTGKEMFKDDPCQFHDGFSGTCWKGFFCRKSHAKYTGGLFAEKFPDVAMAASARISGVYISTLPKKTSLHKNYEFIGQITHVESPSDFYICYKKEGGVPCLCQEIDKWLPLSDDNDEEVMKGRYCSANPLAALEAYEYGFSAMEYREQDKAYAAELDKFAEDEEKLQACLNNCLVYKKYQKDSYVPNVEVVAARVNERWKRGIVLWESTEHFGFNGKQRFRVQLLDTGEKLTLDKNDVCQLPLAFIRFAPLAAFQTVFFIKAYRCLLFGVSAVWSTYSKNAINRFKQLVEGKDLRIVVKQGNPGEYSAFERRPYFVKIGLVGHNDAGKETDVAEELVKAGLALPWNAFPKRPFINKVVSPHQFVALNKIPPNKVQAEALKLENQRLDWFTKKCHDYETEKDVE